LKYTEKVEKARSLIEEMSLKYPKIAVACSFGKDSMVVLHLALQVNPQFPVFSVMTPFKFKETLTYKAIMEKEWNLNIKTYRDNFVEEQYDLYYRNPDACCQTYKVEQTRKAVKNLDAWITGLRRTEGRTRTDYQFIEERNGLVKVNPILDFTELDVWRYLATNNIPVNPLYKEGYRSLGCEPCSRKEEDENELERQGRWQGTSKCGGECGIHTRALR